MSKLCAYLIIAHEDFDILKKTLAILDDEQADFYLHIDKKVKDKKLCDELAKCVNKSGITFVEPVDVQWGSFTQIQSEIIPMKAALNHGKYSYIHLLSGVDMPLKTPSQINAFLKENMGKEFIDIDENAMRTKSHYQRVAFYHLFQQKVGKNKSGVLYYMQKGLVSAQKLLHINRIRNIESFFYKGANWFTITYEMAEYIADEIEKLYKLFRHSICADEVFLQSIAMNSPYKDNIVNDFLRLIDWKRGDPYTFCNDDFEELITSDKLFARKFSTKKDSIIIERLYDYLMKQKTNEGQH